MAFLEETDLPRIFLLGRNGSQLTDLAQHLQLSGFSSHVYTRQNQMLADMQASHPFALILDESGSEDGELFQALTLAAKLVKGAVIYTGSPMPVLEQIELMRAGITDFFCHPFDLERLVDRIDNKVDNTMAAPYRVLVLDDSETVTRVMSSVLTKAGMEVKTLHNPLEVFVALDRFRPDVLLLDVYMPQCTGDEVARIIRQNSQYDSIPIVFLSTETSQVKQLFARSMGGDDFLEKSMHVDDLVTSVRITIERYRKLRHWMTRDSLTSLLNHTNLTARLEEEVSLALAEVRPLAFAMIDIDHFKKVNDSYGHSVGDRVIRALSRLLRQNFGNTDLIGRYGGEEFAVILPNMALNRAAQKVDDLRQRFANLIIQASAEVEFKVSLSAGVAWLDDTMRSQQLIDAADEALYHAKNSGRNQVCMAESKF